jgi:hypothetical protein
MPTQDDCNPHGIPRPLIVNGETVLTCCDCLGLFTISHGDINDSTHLFECYDCRDAGENWQKDSRGRWGRVPKAVDSEAHDFRPAEDGECRECGAENYHAHPLCPACRHDNAVAGVCWKCDAETLGASLCPECLTQQ